MKNYGVIFDLDGTLWDVAGVTHKSANEVAKKYGLNYVTEKAILDSFGLPKEGSAKNFFPHLPLDVSVPYVEEIISLNIDNLFKLGGRLYPNVIPMLEELSRDYGLFIVTNSPQRRYAESFIYSSNTGKYFRKYYSAGELGLTKAQAIKKTVNDFKLQKAVYVGDTQTDCDSAKEAGVGFIYADYGFGNLDAEAVTVSGLDELPAAVKRVFSEK